MSDSHITPIASQPRSLADLFWSFTILAMQGFGGVVAIVQRELVDKKHWMTREEFVEEWAVAQVMPGPNVVNLAMIIGNQFFWFARRLECFSRYVVLPPDFIVASGAALCSGGTAHWRRWSTARHECCGSRYDHRCGLAYVASA